MWKLKCMFISQQSSSVHSMWKKVNQTLYGQGIQLKNSEVFVRTSGSKFMNWFLLVISRVKIT